MVNKKVSRSLGILVVLLLINLVILCFFQILPMSAYENMEVVKQSMGFGILDCNYYALESQYSSQDCCENDIFISYENSREEGERQKAMTGYFYSLSDNCCSPDVFITHIEKEAVIEEEVMNHLYFSEVDKCEPEVNSYIVRHYPEVEEETLEYEEIYIEKSCCE
jgi:hypothetical protein